MDRSSQEILSAHNTSDISKGQCGEKQQQNGKCYYKKGCIRAESEDIVDLQITRYWSSLEKRTQAARAHK